MSLLDPGVVRVERDIDAPPQLVYEAWTDPDSLRIWMAPDPMSVGAAACDVRVGGEYKIVMVDDSGAIEHRGVYERLEPPHRLVFTWNADHLAGTETRVCVTLTPIGAGTRMLIEHELLPAEHRDSHQSGWTSIAAKLETTLAPQPK